VTARGVLTRSLALAVINLAGGQSWTTLDSGRTHTVKICRLGGDIEPGHDTKSKCCQHVSWCWHGAAVLEDRPASAQMQAERVATDRC